MARIETTNGDVIITIDQCECGLTGGCDKCKPIIIPKQCQLKLANRYLKVDSVAEEDAERLARDRY